MTRGGASDIAVIGGGLTGLMTAVALSHAGPRIHLVDRAEADTTHPDERTTTINAAGARMLGALGVWDRLDTPPAPVMRIAVAEGAAPMGLAARRRPDSDLSWQSADGPMGYVVANAALQSALRDTLATTSVAERRGRAVTNWSPGETVSSLDLVDAGGAGETLQASLAVACDGARSTMAEHAGLGRREERQTQTAVVTTLRAERPHGDTAFQRFLPTGPFALMPGPGDAGGYELSLVWTLPNETARQLIAADAAAFEAACLEAFGSRLGYMALAGDRLAWPLQPAWRRRITAPGLVLAGDAAHSIHPLAGQGYNLALADAAVLADLVVKAHRRGLVASHPSLRSAYEAARFNERLTMSMATSGLNKLFAAAPPVMRQAAGMGFSILDRLPGKSMFSEIAEGGRLAEAALLEGRLPGEAGH